ncbi:MAG TPA: phage holin family protein, partial [Steroidobacteraceae bacterium]
LVLWALIALMAGAMGLLFAGLALIFAFWDTHRVLVAALIMAVFLVLALAATSVVFGRMRRQRGLFATTLTELAKDREFLRAPP